MVSVMVILPLLATPLISNIDEGQENPIPHPQYDYDILWDQEWSDGNLCGASRNAIDSMNNIIVCGLDNNESGILLKYDENGNLSWDVGVTSSQQRIAAEKMKSLPMTAGYRFIRHILESFSFSPLMDVAVDSNDDIVSAGTFFEDESYLGRMIVVKYGPNGNQLWNRTYHFLPLPNASTLGVGLTIDSNDNIYVAGVIMNEDLPFVIVKGVVAKLSPNGHILWVRFRRGLLPTIYVDVDVDSNDNVFASGTYLNLFTQQMELIVTKYGKSAGWRLNEKIITVEKNVLPISIKIDRDDNNNIYTVGGTDKDNITGFITKLDSNLNLVWSVLGHPGSIFTDVAIMKDKTNMAISSTIGTNHYHAAVYNKHTGDEKLDMDLGPWIGGGYYGLDDYMKGISVDNEGNVIVTGARGALKTIKVHVTTGCFQSFLPFSRQCRETNDDKNPAIEGCGSTSRSPPFLQKINYH